MSVLTFHNCPYEVFSPLWNWEVDVLKRNLPQSNPKLIKPTHITSFSLLPSKTELRSQSTHIQALIYVRMGSLDKHMLVTQWLFMSRHINTMTQCSLPSLLIHTQSMFFFVFPVNLLVMMWHVYSPWLVSSSSVWRLHDRLQRCHSQSRLPRELPEQPGLQLESSAPDWLWYIILIFFFFLLFLISEKKMHSHSIYV